MPLTTSISIDPIGSENDHELLKKSSISKDNTHAFELGKNDGDVEPEHLQELEVDVERILEDEGIEDYEADTSPYPEGNKHAHVSIWILEK